MTETSDYGNLSVSGSGTVNNTITNGALGHVGEYGTPGFDVGGSPLAFYEDTLTITGTGPVNIQFTDVFTSSVFYTASAQAALTDELIVNGSWDNFLYSSGTATNVLTFNPGDQVTIEEGILGGGNAYAPNAAPPYLTPNFNYSGSGPLYIDVLTPGGGYSAASGTVYSSFDNPAVPEPNSFLLLGTGLISIVGLARSRKLS